MMMHSKYKVYWKLIITIINKLGLKSNENILCYLKKKYYHMQKTSQ